MITRLVTFLMRPFAQAFADAIAPAVVKAFMAYREEQQAWQEMKMCAAVRGEAQRMVEFSVKSNRIPPDEQRRFLDEFLQRLIKITLMPYPEVERVFGEQLRLEAAKENGRREST